VKAPSKEEAVVNLFERVEDAMETNAEIAKLLEIEHSAVWTGSKEGRVAITNAFRSLVREEAVGVCMAESE